MINILKIRLITVIPGLVYSCLTMQYAKAQVIELKTDQGRLTFQLAENHKFIVDYLLSEIEKTDHDSVTLTGAVPGYMISVWPRIKALPVADSVRLQPTGPHYRGVLTAPIDIDLNGTRTLRLDRMMIVHGKSYTTTDVKTLHAGFDPSLKKDLFIRLYDTVIKYRFTPLADTLKDRYGRADRKKIKQQSEPLLDSLSQRFTRPDLTESEIYQYEMRNGLPAMDGKYLIIGTLKQGEEALNLIMNEQVNKTSRAHWGRVNE